MTVAIEGTMLQSTTGEADTAMLSQLVNKLAAANQDARKYDAYYNGAIRLATMGLSLPPELVRLQVVVNWCRLVVDSIEERLDVEGFRESGNDKADEELGEWWQFNNLDEESSLVHLEALVQRRGYTTVGFPDDKGDPPVITVESSAYMYADHDPRTKKVRAALRIVKDEQDANPLMAVIYTQNETSFLEYDQTYARWTEIDRQEHRLGVVPVSILANRARISDRYGRSEMHDVMPLTDAACRSMTNLQGAQELLAVPQRYVAGATEADFIDSKTGKAKTTWEAYMGRLWALGNAEAKVGQLDAANLENFSNTINLYAQIVSSLSGLPPHFLGQVTDNPASADAIRSSESRLVKRAERKIRAFSGPWENTMNIARLMAGQDTKTTRLETIWADPSTPTYAAKADAVTKLFAAGIIPVEECWEQLGYSTTKQQRLTEMMNGSDPLEKYAAQLAQLNNPKAVTPNPAAPLPVNA